MIRLCGLLKNYFREDSSYLFRLIFIYFATQCYHNDQQGQPSLPPEDLNRIQALVEPKFAIVNDEEFLDTPRPFKDRDFSESGMFSSTIIALSEL